MEIPMINALPDTLIKALCNTLVHSLWQGLILAAVAGLIVVFTRKLAAALRYNLLVASLLLFACSVAYTFTGQYYQASITSAQPVITGHNIVQQVPAAAVNIASQNPFTITLAAYLNQYSNIIVLIWLLVVCARSLQLLTGLHGLHQLRHRSIYSIDAVWEQKVQQLAVKLGIKQLVGIAESGMAKVPMVIGHLKPLILIPVGLITALSPAEIDAILVHELAHIRRRDYLVNLLQSLMEIVFFFNPAVLWISSLIKTERENCCDDIAVLQTSSKVNYIRALVSCQEYQLQAPAYAMALNGKGDNHLLGRVKRMVSNSNQSLNLMEKSLLAVCLLIAALCTTAFTNVDKIDKLIATTTKAVAHAVKRTVTTTATTSTESKYITKLNEPDTTTLKLKIYNPAGVGKGTLIQIPNNGYTTFLNKKNGVVYQLNYSGNELVSMQVNGKTVPEGQTAAYQKIIDSIKQQDLANADKQQQTRDVAASDSSRQNVSEASQSLGPLSPLNVSVQVPISAPVAPVANVSVPAKVAVRAKVAKPARAAVAITPGMMAEADSTRQAYIAQADNYKRVSINADAPASYKAHNIAYNIDKEKKRVKTDAIIAEMIQDGLIAKDDKALSFKLSTEEFILNGKKQPEDVYRKYRAQYVKQVGSGQWSWMYNYDVTTTTTSESKK